MCDDKLERLTGLNFWKGAIDPIPLAGGITNDNFIVADAGEKFFVRLGDAFATAMTDLISKQQK